MGETTTKMFVILVCFWTLLTILTNIFEESFSYTDISEFNPDTNEINNGGHNKLLGWVFNTLDEVPLINAFVPLMKIMTYQYVSGIPGTVSILLNITIIISAYIVYAMIRGN